MKAKEMIRRVTNPNFAGKHLVGSVIFTEEEFAILWSQLCKEQRELCLKSHIDQLAEEFGDFIYELSEDKTDDAILNAPEPEIE